MRAGLVDVSLLVAVTVPVVYFLVIRPYDKVLHRAFAELEVARSEADRLARTDPLTGLENRRTFVEQLDREWARATRQGNPLACLMVDIDHFKLVNDTWGHPGGDEVLKAVARELLVSCRASDILARVGGEEMAVILPDTDEASALACAERLRAVVAAMVVRVGEAEIRVTASFGAAARTADHQSPIALVASADAALFDAKRAGRNRVEVACPRPRSPELTLREGGTGAVERPRTGAVTQQNAH